MALVKAELARFYGWTDDYIMGLELNTFHDYYSAIPVIKSAECLSDINNISYPHQKPDSGKKYIKDLQKNLAPYQKETSMSELDLNRLFGGL